VSIELSVLRLTPPPVGGLLYSVPGVRLHFAPPFVETYKYSRAAMYSVPSGAALTIGSLPLLPTVTGGPITLV
jgi:hypothetical protein